MRKKKLCYSTVKVSTSLNMNEDFTLKSCEDQWTFPAKAKSALRTRVHIFTLRHKVLHQTDRHSQTHPLRCCPITGQDQWPCHAAAKGRLCGCTHARTRARLHCRHPRQCEVRTIHQGSSRVLFGVKVKIDHLTARQGDFLNAPKSAECLLTPEERGMRQTHAHTRASTHSHTHTK